MRSLLLFGFGFLPGSCSSSAELAATGGGCSVMNVFSPSPASSGRLVLETWKGRSSRSQGVRYEGRYSHWRSAYPYLRVLLSLSLCPRTASPSRLHGHPCLDLELPLRSRVDIQVVKGIQIRPVAPNPTGWAWAWRAFDLHSAGRERDGDLSVREGGYCPRSVGGIEYRRRYGRQNARARYRRTLDDGGERSGGRGADLDGAIAMFDHKLPTDEVEVVLALKKIFLTVGLPGTARMNLCAAQ